MQEAVKTYAEQVRRAHGAVVKLRVGLNSGVVVVCAIGSDLHMDHTAVGQATHLTVTAARPFVALAAFGKRSDWVGCCGRGQGPRDAAAARPLSSG
jgi:class 3 adenylate cyclase